MGLRRFIHTFETPLHLCGTLVRLSHRHKYPILALLRLFVPLPTWHFPVPEPIPFRTMLDNIPLLESRMASEDLTNMRSVPIWRARDTPIRSLYRLYEAMAAGEYYAIGPEVEYSWYQRSWILCRVPDPRDPDPVRYAILASIAEELAKAFNWRLSLGMRSDKRKHIYCKTLEDVLPPYTPETVPSWTERIRPIDVERVADLPDALDSSGSLVLETGGKSPIFAERNIVTDTGHFYTI